MPNAVLLVGCKTHIVMATHKLHGLYDSTFDTLWIGIRWQRMLEPMLGWNGVIRRPADVKLQDLEVALTSMLAGTVVNGTRVFAEPYVVRRRTSGRLAWTFSSAIQFGTAVARPIANTLQLVHDGWVPTTVATREATSSLIQPDIRRILASPFSPGVGILRPERSSASPYPPGGIVVIKIDYPSMTYSAESLDAAGSALPMSGAIDIPADAGESSPMCHWACAWSAGVAAWALLRVLETVPEQPGTGSVRVIRSVSSTALLDLVDAQWTSTAFALPALSAVALLLLARGIWIVTDRAVIYDDGTAVTAGRSVIRSVSDPSARDLRFTAVLAPLRLRSGGRKEILCVPPYQADGCCFDDTGCNAVMLLASPALVFSPMRTCMDEANIRRLKGLKTFMHPPSRLLGGLLPRLGAMVSHLNHPDTLIDILVIVRPWNPMPPWTRLIDGGPFGRHLGAPFTLVYHFRPDGRTCMFEYRAVGQAPQGIDVSNAKWPTTFEFTIVRARGSALLTCVDVSAI